MDDYDLDYEDYELMELNASPTGSECNDLDFAPISPDDAHILMEEDEEQQEQVEYYSHQGNVNPNPFVQAPSSTLGHGRVLRPIISQATSFDDEEEENDDHYYAEYQNYAQARTDSSLDQDVNNFVPYSDQENIDPMAPSDTDEDRFDVDGDYTDNLLSQQEEEEIEEDDEFAREDYYHSLADGATFSDLEDYSDGVNQVDDSGFSLDYNDITQSDGEVDEIYEEIEDSSSSEESESSNDENLSEESEEKDFSEESDASNNSRSVCNPFLIREEDASGDGKKMKALKDRKQPLSSLKKVKKTIQKHKRIKGPKGVKRTFDYSLEGCPLEIRNDSGLKKYWYQRYRLFSKFDKGIKLDKESWYSVTPEKIAKDIAKRFKHLDTVVDGFCGCGGNTIQLAKLCKKVIAIDIDPLKIEYAKHNARIYGVEHKIEFIVGDFMKLGGCGVIQADGVFLSPPWGGPDYLKAPEFDLITMIPMDGFQLFKIAQIISQNIAYFVPRNVNRGQLGILAGKHNSYEFEKNMMDGMTKAITAYYGDLVWKPPTS